MKVVFPVEYWPTSSTMGLLWKSAGSRAGEWKSWKRYVSSSGSSFLVYRVCSPSVTVWYISPSLLRPPCSLFTQLNILIGRSAPTSLFRYFQMFRLKTGCCSLSASFRLTGGVCGCVCIYVCVCVYVCVFGTWESRLL